jgi:hypothetical protein
MCGCRIWLSFRDNSLIDTEAISGSESKASKNSTLQRIIEINERGACETKERKSSTPRLLRDVKRYSLLNKKKFHFRLGYNATKDSFDFTPANRIQTGSETERRNRGFFQTEATVGMD